MRKTFKFLTRIVIACAGIAIIVSLIENYLDKHGWSHDHSPRGIYERHLKRPMDFTLALLALLFLWPVMLIIALMVRVKLGSPILFTQVRPGLRPSEGEAEQVFTLYKFRTMTERLVIIGQTEESAVNTGFRKVSPNHSNWGRDLYSGIVWNKTVYGEMKLIA